MAVILLPDVPLPTDATAELRRAAGGVVARHRSGRPWILGSTTRDQVQIARLRNIDVVSLAPHAAQRASLEAAVSRCDSLPDLEKIADGLVQNDTIVIARSADELRAYCPILLTRSLFWTTFRGICILGDEQRPLASLHSYAIDVEVLSARLANLEIPYPFSRQSIWLGVEALGPGEYLSLRGSTDPKRVVWWSPPAAEQPLDELAPVLSDGMRDTITTRANHHEVISTDLSGGLDSTTLSFYAADLGLPHHTLYLKAGDRTNNDYKWASRAAREIGSHHISAPYRAVLDEIERRPITLNNQWADPVS